MSATATIPKKAAESGTLTSEKFPLENRSLHLAIELRETELLACLLDKHANRYIAWHRSPVNNPKTELYQSFKQDILNNKLSGISVSFTANSFVLVPAPFFKKELVSDYLGFQQLDKVNETPCFDHLKTLDSYNLYTVNNDILSAFRKQYPNASFRHSSSIFMEYILIENKHSHDNKVFVSVLPGCFDVVVLKAGKLVLANRFYYSNSSDFIYYLLWVYEQLGLDTEKDLCTFYGDIDPSAEPYTLCANYVKNISLGGRNNQSTYAEALAPLPAHKYRSLFTQYLCV